VTDVTLDSGPTVFGADEQTDVAVDVPRWVRLASLVLDDEGVLERFGADVEMSLLFVDESTIADLNERFLGATGPTDVLAFPLDEEVPPGGRQPDEGGRGPGSPSDPGDPPALLGDGRAWDPERGRSGVAGRARRVAPPRVRPCRSRGCGSDAAEGARIACTLPQPGA